MLKLSIEVAGEVTRYPLESGETMVGRVKTSDVFIDDASISRRHARFQVADDRCVLIDLGSSNGTYCNDELIKECDVHDGDRLIFGSVTAWVEETVDERLALSDDHSVLDAAATVYRSVGTGTSEHGIRRPVVDVQRLVGLLSEVGKTLISLQPLADVLGRVVDQTFDCIPAERVFLLLKDDEDGKLAARVARRRDGATLERTTISRTVADMVMNDRVAMMATDAQGDIRLSDVDSIVLHDIRSFICAPLWNLQNVIGILYVDNPRAKSFTEADLDLCVALANFAAVAIEQARLTVRVLEESRRRERLQRYHSPAVVARILEGSSDAEAAFIAQERDITVLFIDIVGFTSISQGMSPPQVARFLNGYFGRLSEVIFEFGGTLDKFIGDAILAVFGAPLDQPAHPLQAVRAALAMRDAVRRVNEEQPDQPIQVRIGINTGTAFVGDLGAPRRREFTVLGSVVNAAERLEHDVAQAWQIVVGPATYEQIRSDVRARSLGKVRLRGLQEELEAFEIEDLTTNEAEIGH